MKKTKSENLHNIVYSTNKDANFEIHEEENITLPPEKQNLKVMISKKGRKGKTATVITDFIGNNSDLETLGKELKAKCGTGGAVKEGEIILQGDKRDKVLEFLHNKGYKAKKAGG